MTERAPVEGNLTHFGASEGRDDRDVVERIGTAHDVLKYGFPRETGKIEVNSALIRLAAGDLLLNCGEHRTRVFLGRGDRGVELSFVESKHGLRGLLGVEI